MLARTRKTGVLCCRPAACFATALPARRLREEAAADAVRTAGETIRDLRVAEVVKQDIHLEEGGAITYRTKLQLSFKYEHES